MAVLFSNLSVFEQFLSVFHRVFNFTLDLLSVQKTQRQTPAALPAAVLRHRMDAKKKEQKEYEKKKKERLTESTHDWFCPPESEQAAFNKVVHKSAITRYAITIWTGL